MRTTQLKKLITVIPINKDSTNIIAIDKRGMSLSDAHQLAHTLKKKHKADFGVIVMTLGLPKDVIGLFSAKDLKDA